MFNDPYELNYTKVKSYIDCPILYKYRYVDCKRPPLNKFSSLGLSIHRALEKYHTRKSKTFEDIKNGYIDCWVNAGFADVETQVEYFHRGLKILEDFWQFEKKSKAKTVYSEKKIEFKYGKWVVKGIIDRVDKNDDGSWEVIDYKSGTEMATEENVKENLQLGIYALGLRKNFNIKVNYLSIHLLAYNKKVTVKYDEKKEPAVLEKLAEAGEGILQENFKPHTEHCHICSFNKICGFSIVGKDGLTEEQI